MIEAERDEIFVVVVLWDIIAHAVDGAVAQGIAIAATDRALHRAVCRSTSFLSAPGFIASGPLGWSDDRHRPKRIDA
jgi:hypothetical protein